jgi:uncharacterized protein YcsI (UPF0317 family)
MNRVDLASCSGRQVRELCRRGAFVAPTTGAARDYVQVNLVILEAALAREFEDFCRANPGPCPLLETTDVGSFEPKRMAPGADLRTDLPRYRVLRHGQPVERPTDILDLWADESAQLVAFLIGCSFTFESALLRAGVPVRHLEEGKNVPMYRTRVSCRAVGAFSGPLVVSMRPMTEEQAAVATTITAAMPLVHGAPVHIGHPRELGIVDILNPDYGEAVTIQPHEVPVFWACGVTPMEAIMRARPPLAVTHEPGHMLVTDVLECELMDGTWSPSRL